MPETMRMSQKSRLGVDQSGNKDALAAAGAAHGMIAEDKDEVATVPKAVQEAVAEEEISAEVSEVVVVEALPAMEKAAAYEKMEKAAAYDRKRESARHKDHGRFRGSNSQLARRYTR